MSEGGAVRGRIALVTGAGRGIGQAAAVALARAGADVAVLARTREQVEETAGRITAAGRRSLAVTADVADAAAVATAVAEVVDAFGAVDILVNNAGANRVFGPLWECDASEWWQDVTVNLFGPFLRSAAVLPRMVERGGGRIINVVSGTAGRPFPYNSAYATSKAALVRLTDCLAAETDGRGPVVFALGPGTVRTDISLGLERSERGRRWLGGVIDQLNFIGPEAAAEAVVFFASGRGDALSGRWVDATDDLPALVEQASAITAGDLFQLRRTKLPQPTREVR